MLSDISSEAGETQHRSTGICLHGLPRRDGRLRGDAYEEYLLDELAESDPRRYVMRVMIPVTG